MVNAAQDTKGYQPAVLWWPSPEREPGAERCINCLEHYHAECVHQGLGNRLIELGQMVGRANGNVQCRERLGGLLQYYYRDAA